MRASQRVISRPSWLSPALLLILFVFTFTKTGQAGAGSLPPVSVRAQASNQQIILTWTQAGEAARFRVYRSYRTGQDYAPVGEVPARADHDTLSFTDSGLINRVTYYYVVAAIDFAGVESALSEEAAAMPNPQVKNVKSPSIDPPTGYPWDGEAPVIFSTVFELQGAQLTGPAPWLVIQVRLGSPSQPPQTWTQVIPAEVLLPPPGSLNLVAQAAVDSAGLGSSAEVYYVFCFSTDGGLSWGFFGPRGTILAPDQVQTVETLGVFKRIPQTSVGTPDQPGAPVLASAGGDNLSFTWAAAAGEVAGYDIYRARSPDDAPRLVKRVWGAASLDFEDAGLSPLTHYTYRVRAFNAGLRYSLPSPSTTLATTAAPPVNVVIRTRVPPVPRGPVYLNRLVSADHLPLDLDWQAQPMDCDWDTLVCTLGLTLQQGVIFSFDLSRGNPGSIWTLPDGNTPVPNTAFQVSDAIGTVDLTVYAWDDPLVIDYRPTGQAMGAAQPVSVTWNQAMPPSTTFTVEEKTGAQYLPVPGTLRFSQDRRALRFDPNGPLHYGAVYHVNVAGQVDLYGNPQQVPIAWDFVPVLPRLFLPVISLP
mgnify:CR=1 FL=1